MSSLKKLDRDSIKKIKSFYKNPPSNVDKESIENHLRFVYKIKENLMAERDIGKYKSKSITETDYEDIAFLVVINAINIPMIENYDDPGFCICCARCCNETETIMLTPKDYKKIKESIKDIDDYVNPHPKFSNRYLINSLPCVFNDLETKRCTIHDIRPTVCRNFPISVRKINGKIIKMIYILPECQYSIKLMSKVAADIFDRFY